VVRFERSRLQESRFPSEGADSPGRLAFFGCLIATGLICLAMRPLEKLLQVWWAELAFCALIPVSVAFIILYCSGFRRELSHASRILFLVSQAGFIFCLVWLIIGVSLIATCLCLYRSNAIH
jgi:hypothetical protein